MGLKHLVHNLRAEDIEHARVLRQGRKLRQRVDPECAPDDVVESPIPAPDMGGRTFEDRQSAEALSTLVGRGGLKGKVMDHVPPVPSLRREQDQASRLRDRLAVGDRTIPGGLASRFGIRPAEG